MNNAEKQEKAQKVVDFIKNKSQTMTSLNVPDLKDVSKVMSRAHRLIFEELHPKK